MPEGRVRAVVLAICMPRFSELFMDWDILKDFIKPELMVLIPVLYLIGLSLKKSEKFSDKYIPLLLGICGIVLSILYVGATSTLGTWQDVLMLAFVGITQGILTAGASVYINQMYKQLNQK